MDSAERSTSATSTGEGNAPVTDGALQTGTAPKGAAPTTASSTDCVGAPSAGSQPAPAASTAAPAADPTDDATVGAPAVAPVPGIAHTTTDGSALAPAVGGTEWCGDSPQQGTAEARGAGTDVPQARVAGELVSGGTCRPAPTQPALTVLASSLGLLALVGFSCGLTIWELLAGEKLADFVLRNALAPTAQRQLLKWALGGPGLALLAAGGYLAWRRSRALPWLTWLSHRLAPLTLAALVPPLLEWRIWRNQDLPFLLLTVAFVLAFQHLLRLAMDVPAAPHMPAWLAGARAVTARWSGRIGSALRGTERYLPFVIVMVAALGYAVFFAYSTIVHHRNILSSSLDLGLEDNVVWNTLHGGPLFKASPFGGPEGSVRGWHATYFAFLIAPFYALRQNAETLLLLQAVLIGGAAVPLYLYARKHLAPWTACLIAVGYVFYPPVHGGNLYDFHYPPLAPFFIWFTLFFVEARRYVLAIVCALITLSIREDISMGMAVVGTFLLLTGRRQRAAITLIALGLGYFVAMKMIIMPLQAGFQAFVYQYEGLVAPGSAGFGGVLKTVFSNPAYTMYTLVDQEKLIYLLQIFLPLAFLPLRRPIVLLCCAPGFFFTLLSTGYRPLYQSSFQYTAHWTAYLFPALIATLAWMKQRSRGEGAGGVAWRRSHLAAFAVAMLLTTHQMGALLQQNTVRGGFGPYHFGTDASDRARRTSVRALVAMVPPRAKISASEYVVPQVSNRPDAYTLRGGPLDAEYMLFPVPAWPEETTHVAQALSSGAFGVMAQNGDFVLARRGHPTTDNARILARMGR